MRPPYCYHSLMWPIKSVHSICKYLLVINDCYTILVRKNNTELWTFILLDKKLINCNMIQRLCSSFSRMMSWLNVLQAYLDNLVWVSKPCRPWEYFNLYFSTWCFITKYKYLIAVIGAWCQRPIRGSSVHPGVSVEYRPILQERSSFIKSRQQVGAQFYSLIHFVQTGEGKRMLR